MQKVSVNVLSVCVAFGVPLLMFSTHFTGSIKAKVDLAFMSLNPERDTTPLFWIKEVLD